MQILVSASARRLALVASAAALLAACGQKGPLYMPQGEAGTGRASLGELLTPSLAPSTAVTVPATPASAPPDSGKAVPGGRP